VLALADLRDFEQHPEVRERGHACTQVVGELRHGGGQRSEVAAVGWQQHDAAKAARAERAHELGHERMEGLLAHGHRAGEADVMAGAADAHGGGDERVEALGDRAREVVADQGVRREWHVAAVLLGRAEREHDRVVPRLDLRLHLRPGHRVQLEGGHRHRTLGACAREGKGWR